MDCLEGIVSIEFRPGVDRGIAVAQLNNAHLDLISFSEDPGYTLYAKAVGNLNDEVYMNLINGGYVASVCSDMLGCAFARYMNVGVYNGTGR